MQLIVRWLTIALPFLTLAHTALALINPSIAAGLQEVIDALTRLINTTRIEAGNITGPARGLAEINTFGNNVITLLTSLKTADMSREEKIRQTQRLVDSLSDATQVYQARRGADGMALAEFKVKALALRTEIANG